MLEKSESETEDEDCVINVNALHLRLENWDVTGEKTLCSWRIQVPRSLEQVVSWLKKELRWIADNVK